MTRAKSPPKFVLITGGYFAGLYAEVKSQTYGGATLALPGCLLNLPQEFFTTYPAGGMPPSRERAGAAPGSREVQPGTEPTISRGS